MSHYAGLLFRIRCGDHAIFCRRTVFEKIGGYPEVPLMEDVEIYRILLQHGKMVALQERVITSSRRFEEMGAWRITASYTLIMILYVAGVSPRRLARIYGRLCAKNSSESITGQKTQVLRVNRHDQT